MLPLPISPNPPALLTALASRQPLAHIIPACMMGYGMLKRVVMGLVKVFMANNYKHGNCI